MKKELQTFFSKAMNFIKNFWPFLIVPFLLALFFNFPDNTIVNCPDTIGYRQAAHDICHLDLKGLREGLRPFVYPFFWIVFEQIGKFWHLFNSLCSSKTI